MHSLDGVEITAIPPEIALYPYGTFTTFVAAHGAVVAWPQHVERLTVAVREMWGHQVEAARLADLVRGHLRRRDDDLAVVRVTIYPERLELASPKDASGCRVLISSRRHEPGEESAAGLRVRSVAHARSFPQQKATDISSQIRLRREAQLAGYDDALFVIDGQVHEGATWSVLTLGDGKAVTPEAGVLPSITVGQLGLVVADLGLEFTPGPVSVAALHDAELVLAVNATHPLRVIRAVDDRSVPVGRDLLREVDRAYAALDRILI